MVFWAAFITTGVAATGLETTGEAAAGLAATGLATVLDAVAVVAHFFWAIRAASFASFSS